MRTIAEPESLASTSLQELMREMLLRLGEDPERDGLRDTPERMERSMQYLTKGYQENPGKETDSLELHSVSSARHWTTASVRKGLEMASLATSQNTGNISSTRRLAIRKKKYKMSSKW
jgi:GTP cyclohydrolase I